MRSEARMERTRRETYRRCPTVQEYFVPRDAGQKPRRQGGSPGPTVSGKWVLVLFFGVVAAIFAQGVSRRYREGERLTYRMQGVNENWKYEIRATGVVKKDAAGKYFEEYAWSKLVSNGSAVTLPPASVEFRQTLSLDPDKPPSVPNLAVVVPAMIGPITDLLTFYADLWLVVKEGKLIHAGDHLYRKHGTPASWADGTYVVLGEDSIDFDMSLTKIDETAKVATLFVRHVPPEQPQVRLPAAWMREAVAGTPNNWVEVAKRDGKFIAAAGKETFDVHMEVSVVDGKILSGTIENPVEAQERDCRDAALTSCGEARKRRILRKVEISLER